jgi:hypothetical protein
MTQDEFDSLAIFVAVVEELRREPFFSEDNHERMDGDTGVFCHPMFLKSAVLPFRKIWMSKERCAFQRRNKNGKNTKHIRDIRNLVFEEFPDRALVEACRERFYDMFDRLLDASFGYGWAKETKRQVINLWLNTQAAHTGPMDHTNKKAHEFDLEDFNKCDARIGREKFEFLFRSSIGTVGWFYIEFAEALAFPLFRKLRDEQGWKPTFEADMALKYKPYPSPDYKIVFDDVFWHLSRETAEETFDRLLMRQRFSGVRAFLRAIFFTKKREVLTQVPELDTLDADLERSNAVILDESSVPCGGFLCRSNTHTGYGCALEKIFFDVYAGPKVRFYDNSREVLSRSYLDFRACLLEERKRQRQPDKPQGW